MKDAADHVAGLHVGRQLAVGDGEGDGADVVGADAHGHFHFLALVILVAGEFLQLADQAAEHVGVVVGGLALEHHAQALEAHAGVDVLGGQRLEVAVGLAVVLHEHEVPDLDDVVVVGVHEITAGNLRDFLVGTEVDVDLRAGTTGAGVAHLPEIVVLVAQQDMVRRHMLEPGFLRLGVEGGAVVGRAFEHGRIELGLVDLVHLGEELPGPVDGLGLEIVAEAPVAQHLEHRVVAAVMAHRLEVVVLAAHAEALLAVGGPGELGRRIAQENILELVHSRVREHQRGVVLDHHGGARNDGVSLGSEELQVLLSNLFCSHHKKNL